MNRILLDGKEVGTLVSEVLPMLIFGEDHSGASLYTIALAAKFYSQGSSLLFLCGYPMAEREFIEQVGGKLDIRRARFCTRNQIQEFKSLLSSIQHPNNAMVVVKNIELFEKGVFDLVSAKQNVVIAGDINQASFKKKILEKKFTTRILFSPLENIHMPSLNKYEGFVMSDDYRGITSLQL